jgi:hypothetical protein
MKPATYQETTEIVIAWARGGLKALLIIKCMTYHCAMMRVSRFRKEYPARYKKIVRSVMV